MFCFKKAHKEDLAGIGALRATIDYLEAENTRLRTSLDNLQERLEEETSERRLLLDRVLMHTTGVPLAPPPANYQAEADMEPVPNAFGGNIADYCRMAEFAEAKLAAEELRQAAINAAKE